MDFQTHNDGFVDVAFTSLQGYIQAQAIHLAHAFGSPDRERSSDGKVTCQWRIRFRDGRIATIYDYRSGPNPPAMTDVFSWHIGGHDSSIVQAVHDAYRESMHTFQDINRGIAA